MGKQPNAVLIAAAIAVTASPATAGSLKNRAARSGA